MSALTSRRAPTPPGNGNFEVDPSPSNDQTNSPRAPPAASKRITRFVSDKLWCIAPPAFVALSGLALYGRMELVSPRGRSVNHTYYSIL